MIATAKPSLRATVPNVSREELLGMVSRGVITQEQAGIVLAKTLFVERRAALLADIAAKRVPVDKMAGKLAYLETRCREEIKQAKANGGA
ncbi:MAG: hypothetical protein ACYTEX_28065 [Planctomycetota bacterium]|jgi:hypothetical protein